MDLRGLIEDPAWMFDFGFSLRRFVPQGDARSPNQWKLGDEFRLPELASLSQAGRTHQARMAWDVTGIFLEIDIPIPPSKGPGVAQAFGETVLHFFIDTRSSPGIHRGNVHCHQFDFRFGPLREKIQHQRMDSRLVRLSRSKGEPKPVDDEDVWGWISTTPKSYGIQVFIDQNALTGYSPAEFDACGVFYIAMDSQYRRYSLARLSHAIPWDDPSLWCRAKLVE
jgi:hypothetical protein